MGFFIPAIGYGAAALGGGTLATGLGSSLVSAFEPLSEALGQTERQQGENEIFDRSADPGRRIKRGFGEKFFDAFTGRDQARMEQFGLDQSTKKINTAITNDGYDLKKITSALGTLELDKSLIPKLDDNQSAESYRLELDRAKEAIQTAQQAQTLYPGVEIKGKDLSEINLAVSQKQKEEKEELKREKKAQYGDTRKDKSDAMVLALMNQQAGNRRADNQFNLQMSQQDYNNRVLEQTDRRNSRKDQREMLMTIMLGLDNIGKNFA